MSVYIWSLAIWSAEYQLPIMLPVLFCFCNVKKKIGKNRCCCRFQLGYLNEHLYWNELFIRLTVRVVVGVGQILCVSLFSFLVLRVECGV